MKNEINHSQLVDEYAKSKVLTEMVSYIGSTEPFEQIAERITTIIGEYLDVTNTALMIVEDDRLEVFTEWVRDDSVEFFQKAKDEIWDTEMVYGESLYTMSKDEQNGKREFLYVNYGISALLGKILLISNRPQMVLLIADRSHDRVWTQANKEFVTNIVKMTEGIIMRKISGKSLVSSRRALKEILDNMASGLFVVDKETREILFSNAKMYGLHKKEIIGSLCCDVKICGEDSKCEGCQRLKNRGDRFEIYDKRFSRWFDVITSEITWIDGKTVELFNLTDITENKNYEKKIEFQANNDFLTGLYNRMRCENDLYEIISDAIDNNTSGYMLFMDLDNFKHINDGLGHQYGDMLLRMISIGLQQIEGIVNNCYRVGGDEFIIIIKPEQMESAEKIINDIKKLFSMPWNINNTEYYSTMSMGIVRYPEDGRDVNELIKKADIAMYHAKQDGRNRIEYYNGSEDSASMKRLDVEKNLRSAIAFGGGEFELYIQPIMDAMTGQCIGGESLIRWNSSELGFLMPMDFIPLAEHLGLIVIIGEYFLKKACRINKMWSDMGISKTLHVNLSVVQLVQNNVVETVSNIIRETGVDPANIILEITESLAINDMDNMKRVIKELKKLGVGIALDDFGTGYSSLSYIKKMNFDIIKVDKNFIDDITTNDYSQTFIKLITELSDKLGAKVCVEGVEDAEQLEVLKTMNVNMIQGYYYGKPMTCEEFQEKFLGVKGYSY